MSIYDGHPFLRGEAQIRLLRIVPQAHTRKLSCVFATFSLDSAPSYSALSYEWGPTSPLKPIAVNNQDTTIRLNLWNFLSRLADHGYHGYIWCDAICINQANDYERNHQVQLMSAIYRTAHSVLVWLGEEDQNSGVALSTIRLISADMGNASQAALLKNRAAVWTALVDISKRRYWTRIWIVQEVTIARNLELFCGTEKVSWRSFVTACEFPPRHPKSWSADLWAPLAEGDNDQQVIRRTAGRQLHHSTMYGLIRAQRRWPVMLDSFEVLGKRYTTSGCQDIRDRVFALLGIAREVVLQRPFAVDYEKNVEETFIALVAWAGTGCIAMNSRIHFASLVAQTLKLEWTNYPLESTAHFGFQRSPSFLKWGQQALSIMVPCLHIGKFYFERSSDTRTARISPHLFQREPVEVHIPLNSLTPPTNSTYDLFGFSTSNIFFACTVSGTRSWTVITRASINFSDSARRTHIEQSVFQGLIVMMDVDGHYSVQIKNVAQFMEIFLDRLDPQVWAVPQSSSGGTPRVGGNSDPAEPSYTDPKYESVRLLRQSLQIRNKVTILDEQQEDEDENSDEDESFYRDWERLKADSDTLAKPRVPRPRMEMPRKPRKRRAGVVKYSVEVEAFPDPYGDPDSPFEGSDSDAADGPALKLAMAREKLQKRFSDE